MKDADCVTLLQWALPRLRMRWRGFRKVRGQVCKRITRRRKELGLQDLAAYQALLEQEPKEWKILDSFCRITISRFFRDREACRMIRGEVLPELAARARREGRDSLDLWSAGCGSGEEPYTLSILWRLPGEDSPASLFPQLALRITATDAGPEMLDRGRRGVYPAGSLKELPPAWVPQAFQETWDGFRLRDEFREGVEFLLHDVRDSPPLGPFELVCCRNLVFTYYEDALQGEILAGILRALTPGGYLVLGSHEELPSGSWPLARVRSGYSLYRREGAPSTGGSGLLPRREPLAKTPGGNP